MKNALFLLSIWVGIIVVAYAVVFWDQGIERALPISVLEPESYAYVDPAGVFGLAVPSAWGVEETETFVLLTDPSGEVEVSVFTAEESVPETALLVALGIAGADGESEAVAAEEVEPVGASERAVRIAGPLSEGEASYGLAYLYEGQSVILLVRGAEESLRSRRDDLGLIEGGITVPAPADTQAAPLEERAPVVEL